MKNKWFFKKADSYYIKRFLVITLLMGFSTWLSAQCFPDTNCIDVDQPGQVCPDSLAEAVLGEEYIQPITFIAPDSAFIGNSGVKISKIILDNIANLPPGITYSADTNIFFPDTMYCVLISGVPSDTGTFYLDVSVIPYIWSDILGKEVETDAIHDSTSMFIRVSLPSGLPVRSTEGFSLIKPWPNPFRESIKVGFTTDFFGDAELVIYNLTGKALYREVTNARPGKNYFRFTGESFSPGIYPYFISSGKNRLSGKLIKIK